MLAPVVVRSATPEDLEVVARISVAAYQAAGQLDDGPDGVYGRVLGDTAARMREAVLLVAFRQTAIVGTVTICPEGSPFREIAREGEVEFRFLAVEPSVWGTGVANALVDSCLVHAREVGARQLVICVRDTNQGARRMYEQWGFARVPERDWRPVPGVELLAMRKLV